MSGPALRRLAPPGPETHAAAAISELELAQRAPAGRPYVVANFAVTADGRATIGGRSGPIGAGADHAMFHALRAEADAVLAGTGTLRAERYGRMVSDEATRAQRVARGLSPEPLATTITRSGSLPLELPLFARGDARVVVFTGQPIEVEGVAADVEVHRLDGAPPADALRILREAHDVRLALCEGGPTLMSALVAESLVDELFLTVAPRLAGGSEMALLGRLELTAPAQLELAWVLEHEGELLLRYRNRPGG